MAAASTSGSPRSRPSEQTTTTPPPYPPRPAHARRDSPIHSPIRAPPCHSTTAAAPPAAVSPAPRPRAEVFTDRLADPRPALPVDDGLGRPAQGFVGVAAGERA